MMDQDDDHLPESGPFCPHGDDTLDCDALCTCGRPCSEHEVGTLGGEERNCEESGCLNFTAPE